MLSCAISGDGNRIASGGDSKKADHTTDMAQPAPNAELLYCQGDINGVVKLWERDNKGCYTCSATYRTHEKEVQTRFRVRGLGV